MNKTARTFQSRPISLRRKVALLLVLKLVLLYAIWALWFDSPMTKEERAVNTARVILNR
jgi:hypothetical protein